MKSWSYILFYFCLLPLLFSSNPVLVHDVVLTSATDVSTTTAARRASDLALDAIEGDPHFMSRTCNCRAQNLARKAAKKAQKGTLHNGEEVEEQLVESVLDNLFDEGRAK